MPEKKPSNIRIVSYNVHSGKNTAEIAEVFLKEKTLSRADIILFQEIEFHESEQICRAESIAKRLGFNFIYEPARNLKNGNTHGLAILSRFDLKNAKSIQLPKYKLLFITQSRIALIAQLEIEGVFITVCNVHLDTRLNPKQRIEQLNACVKKLKESHGQNIIIGGDFNTIPFRSVAKGFPIFYSNQAKYLHKHMQKMGFNYFSKPKGYTMNGAGLLRMKLDYIYSDRLPITDFGVEKHVTASDHKPIWADVEII